MKYQSMYKRYFVSNDNGKHDYELLYHHSMTLHFPISIHNNPCFLVYNNEMIKLIENIYCLNNDIIALTKGNRDIPELIISWLMNQTFVKEICVTNQLEGIVSTRKEIQKLLNNDHHNTYQRFSGMVHSYIELLKNETFHKIENCYDMKKLYDNLLLEDIKHSDKMNIPDGKIFRSDMVHIESGNTTIHKGIYPETKIIDMMNDALGILNDKSMSLLVKVAIFHYMFGYIHPYYDGNVRLSRYISTYYLTQNIDLLCALKLSVSCIQNQKQYYDSFKITNDIRNKGDLTLFVISFLEILESGLKNFKESIQYQCIQYEYYHQMIQKRETKDQLENILLDILLQTSFFDIQDLTLQDLMKLTGHAKDTIKKRLKELEKQKLIIVDKSNKTYSYRFDYSLFK